VKVKLEETLNISGEVEQYVAFFPSLDHSQDENKHTVVHGVFVKRNLGYTNTDVR
jgi:hypothetical protein